MGREVVARVLLFVSAVLIVAAVVAGYVRYELLSERHFSDRAAAALADPDVRSVLSREITDRVILPSEPDLVSARPLIESAVAGLTGSPPFVALFEDSVRRVHAALLSGDDSRLRLDLRDMGVLVQSALVHLPISGADRIRDDVGLRLTAVNSVTETTAEIAHRLRVLSFALIIAALATAAAAIGLARDWRRAVQLLGFSVAGLALAAVLLLAGGRIAVERLSSDQEVDRRAAGAVWDAFLGDLGSLLLLVAAFATVVAAAVASQSTLPDLVPALRRGWELASRKPRRTVWRRGARGRARRARRGDRRRSPAGAAAGRHRRRAGRALRRSRRAPERRARAPCRERGDRPPRPRGVVRARSRWASSRSPPWASSWRPAGRPRRP